MKYVRLFLSVVISAVLLYTFVWDVQAQTPGPATQSDSQVQTTPSPTGQNILTRKDFCNRLGRDYDPERCLTVFEFASEAFYSAWVSTWSGIQRLVVRFLWSVLVFSVAVANFVVSSELFVAFYNVIVGSIESILPSVLRESVFSQNGLFMLIYSFGALLMVIPIITIEGIPKANESVRWGLLLMAFFVTGTISSAGSSKPIGFFILDQLDAFRREVNRIVFAGSNSQTSPIGDLAIGVFMSNQNLNVRLDTIKSSDYNLPPAYIQKHFPEPESQEVTVQFVVGMNGTVERKENAQERMKALEGVLLDVLTALFVSLSVLSIAVGLSSLNIIPMIFIIIFFVALPTIFFEVGRKLLMSIVNSYFAIIIISIMFGVFLRFLVGFNNALRIHGGGEGGIARGAVLLFFNLLFFVVVYSLTQFSISILKLQITALPQNIVTSFAVIPYPVVDKLDDSNSFLHKKDLPIKDEQASKSPYLKPIAKIVNTDYVKLTLPKHKDNTVKSPGNAFVNRGPKK